MITHQRSPALHLCFCIMVLWLLPTVSSARDCQSGLTAKNAIVTKVIDGDTVALASEQRVRLIGLDTLEMNASADLDRLWATKAADALSEMLSDQRITLFSGADRKDRHGRLLAHLRLADGRDAAAQLISQGLGIAVSVGRNTACAQENMILERIARSSQRGLWKTKGSWWSDNEPRLKAARGFHVIRSSVTKTTLRGTKATMQLKNGLTVKLGSSWPTNKDLTRELLSDIDRQIVEVRGWLSGGLSAPQLSLHHPSNLKMVNQ